MNILCSAHVIIGMNSVHSMRLLEALGAETEDKVRSSSCRTVMFYVHAMNRGNPTRPRTLTSYGPSPADQWGDRHVGRPIGGYYFEESIQ